MTSLLKLGSKALFIQPIHHVWSKSEHQWQANLRTLYLNILVGLIDYKNIILKNVQWIFQQLQIIANIVTVNIVYYSKYSII